MSKTEQESIHPDEIDQKELQDFKSKVSKWCEMDNKIKQFEQVVKAHKKQKDELCTDILEFMEGYEISNVKTAFGKIQKIESETKAPITKGLIEDKINSYFTKIGVAEFQIEAHNLSVGDAVIITGPTTGLIETTIEEIHTQNGAVSQAVKGDICSIKLEKPIRKSDKLYKLVSAAE